MSNTIKKEVLHVDGGHKELTTIHDEKGNILHHILHPLRIDIHPHDVVQVIVGATLLAIPVGLTEEVWRLGETLSWGRIGMLCFFSLVFLFGFTYYISYQQHMYTHWPEFLKRVIGTYILSLLVVGTFLFMIDKAPITTDLVVTIKRIIIVAFPASLSAAVVDLIK